MYSLTSRFKVIALLLALTIVFCPAILCSCSKADESYSSAEFTETHDSEFTDSADVQTSDSAQLSIDSNTLPDSVDSGHSSVVLLSSYTPKAAYDQSGNEIALDVAFGTAYSTYGGYLAFTSQGEFSVCVGAGGNPNNHNGTYKILSDSEIQLTYNNGNVDTAEILLLEQGVAKEIRLTYLSIFTVDFVG